MKLISMTDFVLNSYEHFKSPTLFEETVFKYATFLKQPLKLGMFIPCDENENVLNETEWKNFTGKMEDFHSVAIKYDKAKKEVLFKKFYLDETYKREKRQLPYLTNGKVSVFLHFDFAIRHQIVEDLVGSDLEFSDSVSF